MLPHWRAHYDFGRNCALLYSAPQPFFCEACESSTVALIRNVHASLTFKINVKDSEISEGLNNPPELIDGLIVDTKA